MLNDLFDLPEQTDKPIAAAGGGLWRAITDGACAPSNPGPAGWGAILVSPQGQRTEHYGFIGPGTNQIAELSAGIEALRRTPVGAQVELIADSQYLLKGLSEWRAGWERKGFRNSKGERVANLELWKTLFALADQRKVRTRWVKGHSGDPDNDRADALANLALEKRGDSPA
jgi:ribonuclease HI